MSRIIRNNALFRMQCIVRSLSVSYIRAFSTRARLIVGIETSCDDTGVALLEFDEFAVSTREGIRYVPDLSQPPRVLANVVSSQFDTHASFGGIVPALAAREHAKNLPYVIENAFVASGRALPAGFLHSLTSLTSDNVGADPGEVAIKHCEEGKGQPCKGNLDDSSPSSSSSLPEIACIAVTTGPGLSPCLKEGVSAATHLAHYLQVPLLPTNHLEGHILLPRLFPTAPACASTSMTTDLCFPYLTLLVSGGHSMVVVALAPGQYIMLGHTLDDSVGEAFDKVARMLGATEYLSDLEKWEQRLVPSKQVNPSKHYGALLERMSFVHQLRKDAYTQSKKRHNQYRKALVTYLGSNPGSQLPFPPPPSPLHPSAHFPVPLRSGPAAAELRSRFADSVLTPVQIFRERDMETARAGGDTQSIFATPERMGNAARILRHLQEEDALWRSQKQSHQQQHVVLKEPQTSKIAPNSISTESSLPLPPTYVSLASTPTSTPLSIQACAFSLSGLKSAVDRTIQTMLAEQYKEAPYSTPSLLPFDTAAAVANAFETAVCLHLVDQITRALSWMLVQQKAGSLPYYFEESTQTYHFNTPSEAASAPTSSPSSTIPPSLQPLPYPQAFPRLVLCGGVASNAAVRSALERCVQSVQGKMYVPPQKLCTDNGLMIAWAAFEGMRSAAIAGIKEAQNGDGKSARVGMDNVNCASATMDQLPVFNVIQRIASAADPSEKVFIFQPKWTMGTRLEALYEPLNSQIPSN